MDKLSIIPEAAKVFSDEYRIAVRKLIESGMHDLAEDMLTKMCSRLNVPLETDGPAVDFDAMDIGLRNEAKKVVAKIRFSHPHYKDKQDREAYGAIRGKINGIVKLKEKASSFEAASIKVKLEWIKCANWLLSKGHELGGAA
jgi:hypothetical protein